MKMSQFTALLKVLFISRYRGEKKSGKFDPLWIVYGALALVLVPLVAGICWLVAVYTPKFQDDNTLPYFLLMIYMTVMLAVLVFGMVGMLTYVYINRDAEFLAGLPVKGWKIFLAKLCMVYIGELALSAGFILPIGFTVGIAGGYGFAFFLSVVLSVLFVPALPLLLASLISIPLMYCVSFFKNKGATTSIVVLVLVGGIYALYFSLTLLFQGGGMSDAQLEQSVENLVGAMGAMRYALYPVYALIEFGMRLPAFGLTGAGAQILSLAASLASLAALAAAAGLIANFVYGRSAAAQLENSAKRAKKAMAYKAQSPLRALIRKEWRALIRETAFAFQCLFGTVIGPVMVVVLSLNLKDGFAAVPDAVNGATEAAGAGAIDPAVFSVIMSGVIVAVIIMIVSGMNITAATAVSREGKNFYQMKTMPVPYKTQIKAKLYLSLLISMPGSLISFCIGAFLIPIPIVEALLDALFLCVYAYLFACFALRMDLMKPKLNWTTPTQAVKNNRSSTMPIMLNLLAGLVVGGIFVAVGLFADALLAIGVLLVLAVALAPVLHKYLFGSVDRLFEEIEP
ncbi:MAG: hypothetical protein LBL66_01930 [Clostridiales bacterium]|jgi:ABC-2 type transport system permease protein|nr:hypothetical protein [Clostridiales bacterium]